LFASLDTAQTGIYPAPDAEKVGKAPVEFLEWQFRGDVVAESKVGGSKFRAQLGE
jgi:hypothetical protein